MANRSHWLAEAVAAATGRDVVHRDVSLAEFRETLLRLGLPGPVVAMLVSADAAIAAGALDTTSTDLVDLIGHPPTTMRDAVVGGRPDGSPLPGACHFPPRLPRHGRARQHALPVSQ